MMNKFFRNLQFKFFPFLLFAAVLSALLVSCEYYDLPVKSYLLENSAVPCFSGYSFSLPAVDDPAGFACVGSAEDLVIEYAVSNPKSLELRAKVSFPEKSGASARNTSLSVSSGSVLLTIPRGVLSSLDGDTESFDISPSLSLFVAGGEEDEEADSMFIKLRCNSVPAAVSNAVPMMFSGSSSFNNNLVVCIELPADDRDAKYLEVNGHIFDLEEDLSSGLVSGGWTLYKDSFPLGTLVSTVTKPGYEYSAKSGGSSYFVLTDVPNLLSRKVFTVGISVTDKGGLKSDESQISSKTLQAGNPVLKHGSEEVADKGVYPQDEGEEYATFSLEIPESISGAVVSYSIVDSDGNAAASGSGSPPVFFTLCPAEDGSDRTYILTASASAANYVDSDSVSLQFAVAGGALSLESSAGAEENIEVSSSGKNYSYTLLPSTAGTLEYKITRDGGEYLTGSASAGTEGVAFDFGGGTYVVEAILKKSYYKEASFKQTITVKVTQQGGTEIVVPESVEFAKAETKAGSVLVCRISASADGGDITQNIENWNIAVLADGIDISSAAGITVETSGGYPEVKIPDGLAAGKYMIKITADYNGETYSDSIPLEID